MKALDFHAGHTPQKVGGLPIHHFGTTFLHEIVNHQDSVFLHAFIPVKVRQAPRALSSENTGRCTKRMFGIARWLWAVTLAQLSAIGDLANDQHHGNRVRADETR